MAEQYNDAVEKLKDPELRKKYERELEQERSKFRDSMIAELEKREKERVLEEREHD